MAKRFLGLTWVFLLHLLFQSCVSAIEPEWEVVRSDHFVFYTDTELDKAEATVRELENFRRAVIELTQVEPGSDKEALVVIGVEDLDRYPALSRQSKSVAGFFVKNYYGDHIAVMRMDGWAKPVLKHEYVHYVMSHQGHVHYPKWYSEGFAEYLSGTSIDEIGSYESGLPTVLRAETILRNRQLNYQTLVEGDVGNSESDSFYERSWFLTHFLISKYPEGLTCFLEEYAQDARQDPAGIFKRCLPFPLQELDTMVAAYFKEPLISLKGKIKPYSGKLVRSKASRRDRDLALATTGRIRKNLKETDIDAIQAKYPTDPEFLLIQFHHYLAQKEWKKAQGLLASAQAAPFKGRAEFVYAQGLLALKLADLDVKAKKHAYVPAYELFRQAVDLQADYAQALAGMAQSGAQSGKLTNEEAWSALRRAIALRPRSAYNHFVEAQLYYREGKVAEAAQTISLLVGSGHAMVFPPEVLEFAKRLVAELMAETSKPANG